MSTFLWSNFYQIFSIPIIFGHVSEFAGVRYLIGTVSAKVIDPWKNIPLRARRTPAVRKNV